MTSLGILAFIAALLVSVMLHEAGHFLTARHFGMKATQFFVGFGPTVWSRTKGETEYGIKAIPAGGFVKIIGMTPLEEVEPGDEDRAFFKQRAGRKLVVLSAGSTMHFLICLVLVLGTVAIYGTPKEKAPALGAISACVADDPAAACGTPGSVRGPAVAAGLESGDVVLSVEGSAITTAAQLTAAIRPRAGQPTDLVVRRDGKDLPLTVTPTPVTRPDPEGVTRTIGAIGVGVQPVFVNEHYGPVGHRPRVGSARRHHREGDLRDVHREARHDHQGLRRRPRPGRLHRGRGRQSCQR